MREHDDVAQWEDGINVERPGDDGLMLVGHGHPELREPTCPSAPHFLRLQIFDETRARKNEHEPKFRGKSPISRTELPCLNSIGNQWPMQKDGLAPHDFQAAH